MHSRKRGLPTAVIAVVYCLALPACSSPRTTAACQEAVDASYDYPASISDAELGRRQDESLRQCTEVGDFSEGVKRNLSGDVSDELAHDVLAAYCSDPLDPSLSNAPVCEELRDLDPAAFDRI
jgi:hypothetical protein